MVGARRYGAMYDDVAEISITCEDDEGRRSFKLQFVREMWDLLPEPTLSATQEVVQLLFELAAARRLPGVET
ncbi:MAG: hypothetical protein HOW73_48890 [Polyangiaceae bacterium]|nr:hypothetical protein [Polyangiaceae bacterium]